MLSCLRSLHFRTHVAGALGQTRTERLVDDVFCYDFASAVYAYISTVYFECRPMMWNVLAYQHVRRNRPADKTITCVAKEKPLLDAGKVGAERV